MGYSTDFSGSFQLSRPVTVQEKNYLDKLAETRRMKRDVEKLHELYKGKHGNPFAKTREEIYGNEGEYFVGAGGSFGQDSDASVIDYNEAPGALDRNLFRDFIEYWEKSQQHKKDGKCQPGLWLQWVLNEDGTQLEWDGNEKFYGYVEWLKYLINHFFEPWGIKLNGEVEWTGEDRNDIGKIVVTNNVVEVKEGKIIY